MASELVNVSDLGMKEEELFTHCDSNIDSEKITAPRYSYWHSVFRVFFKKKINIVVLAILAFIIIFSYIYPIFSGSHFIFLQFLKECEIILPLFIGE